MNTQGIGDVQKEPGRIGIPLTTRRVDGPMELGNDVLERGNDMTNAEMPHAGHDKHLCYLNNLGFQISYPEEYKELVRNGKFVCKVCGRVAASDKNLCKPVEL